jgi:transcriptional regulator with XRE-family HTH domain
VSENVAKIGHRIRTIRAARGWSQGELAARLGRTQTSVSYWESGRRALGVDDLLEVARALGVPSSDLLPDAAPARPISASLRAVAEQVDAYQLADQLEKFVVEADTHIRPDQRWSPTATSPQNTAEALLAEANIINPPVDVENLASECGIKVLQWDFENVDGLILRLANGPVIGVNREQAATRQRFTIAHELGHYMLEHADYFHVDFGGDLSPSATGEHPEYNWRDERAANDFAANLLMPASFVREAHRDHPDVRTLAALFKVSPAAMGFRLRNLGLY